MKYKVADDRNLNINKNISLHSATVLKFDVSLSRKNFT